MQSKLAKFALLLIAAVMIVSIAFAGAGAAHEGTPVHLTGDSLTNYKVLVVDDESGKVITKSADTLAGEKNVYLLEDAADWNAVANNASYNETVLILGDNLNFTTTDNDCMMTYPFAGNLYGNGYLFESFKNESSTTANVGLIREAETGLYLNYVQMTNSSFKTDGNNINVGSLIGNIPNSKYVTIVGCSIFGGNISSTGMDVGGVVGLVGLRSTLNLLHSKVENTTIETPGGAVGGLIGCANGNSLNVFNSSVSDSWIVTNNDYVGGLVGFINNAESTISSDMIKILDSSVAGCNIIGNNIVGGLVGSANKISVKNSQSINCNITAKGHDVGGLMASANGDSVNISNSSVTSCSITGEKDVGGLVGYTTVSVVDNCSVLHCNVIGTNVLYNDKVAGILGEVENGGTGTHFTNCHAGTDTSTALSVSSSYPLTGPGQTLGTGCDYVNLVGELSLTFPTKEQIQVFPASKLPYLYVTFNATDGAVGSPYSGTKKTVAMPYSRSGATFAATASTNTVTPVNGEYVYKWYDALTGGNKVTSTTPVTSALSEVFARWTDKEKPEYVEANSWSQLNKSVAEWNATGTEAGLTRTVVVTKDITDRVSGNNTDGIEVYGNVILKPAASPAGDYKVDGKGLGRLFYVKESGNLTLVGNGTNVLNLTGGYVTDIGGAGINVNGGKLTVSKGASIVNCSGNLTTKTPKIGGGGVAVTDGNLVLSGGIIANCSVFVQNSISDKIFRGGSAVYLYNSTFTFTSGSITNCTPKDPSKTSYGVYSAVLLTGNSIFNMTGGSISNCRIETIKNNDRGGAVYLSSGSKFNQYGGSITNCSAKTGGGVYLYGDVEYNMYGGTIRDCHAIIAMEDGDGGGVCIGMNPDVPSKFIFHNGNITNCSATGCGGGVSNFGEFILLNGNITDCRAEWGGGVYSICAFEMKGGKIVNCSALEGEGLGGGVYIDNNSYHIYSQAFPEENMTMTGGYITNCSAINGGGVYTRSWFNGAEGIVLSGKFIMENGNITDCRADSTTGNGGGVANNGIFEMKNGNIINCSAANGGGAAIFKHFDDGEGQMWLVGNFTMTGGTISECQALNGGGVYGESLDDGTLGFFNLSGSPAIDDNTLMDTDTLDNVNLSTNASLNLVGAFSGSVGISYAGGKPAVGQRFGLATGGSMAAGGKFTADGTDLVGSVNSDNELVWTEPAKPTPTPTPYTPSHRESGQTVIQQQAPVQDVSADPTPANQATSDVSAKYVSQTVIGTSTSDIAAIKQVSTEAAAQMELMLSTAQAAGIPLTNSKGAKAVVVTDQNIPDVEKVTFSRVYEISPANEGEKLTKVTVKVPKTDVTSKGLTPDDVTVYHFLESYNLWVPLETISMTQDADNYYYTAATDGTSPFGVLVKKIGSDTTVPTTNPTQKSPAPFAGLAAGLGAALVIARLRK